MPSAHLSLLWLPTIVKALLEVLDGFRPRWILSKSGQAATAACINLSCARDFGFLRPVFVGMACLFYCYRPNWGGAVARLSSRCRVSVLLQGLLVLPIKFGNAKSVTICSQRFPFTCSSCGPKPVNSARSG